MGSKEWEGARGAWLKSLNSKATKVQLKELSELDSLKTFSDAEIVFKVFGWRSPISQEIWLSRANRKEKLGLNEAVSYLLRVVLDIPLHPVPPKTAISDATKAELKKLMVVGVENGHIETSGKDIDQSVRSAINEVLKKLGIKTIKAGLREKD